MTTKGDTEAVVMSVAKAAKILGVDRSTVYELIHRGELPVKRLGRTRGWRIPVKAFYDWLNTPDNLIRNDADLPE